MTELTASMSRVRGEQQRRSDGYFLLVKRAARGNDLSRLFVASSILVSPITSKYNHYSFREILMGDGPIQQMQTTTGKPPPLSLDLTTGAEQ